jgi:hypothetical protein
MHGDPLVAGRGPGRTVSLGSLGFFGWAVIAYYAGRRRSWVLALAAVGYFVCAAAFWSTVQDPQLRPGSPKDQIAMVGFLISAAGAAAHAAFLVPGPAFRAAPELLEALEERVRRRQALTLVERYPAIARELRIGCPDLPRVFDDGGLIDVNVVPEPVLAALSGLTTYETWRIVADRQAHGPFPSVGSLVSRGLTAPAAQALRRAGQEDRRPASTTTAAPARPSALASARPISDSCS